MDGIITVFLVADPGTAQPGIVELLLDADLIVQLVLLTLLGMSVVCWYIIFDKARMLRRASAQSAEFLKLFWESRRLDQVYEKASLYPDSPIAEMFKAAYVELHKLTSGTEGQAPGTVPAPASADATDNLTRSLRRAGTVELTRLERMVPFLATTGSTGPFIGLFGTVWGIKHSFEQIAISQNTSLAVVAPGIAEALLATGVGLVAAIPAAVFYNKLSADNDRVIGGYESFADEFATILSRQLDS